MNTILFLCGAGVGALITCILMMAILILGVRNHKSTINQASEHHRQSLSELSRRCTLLEEQNGILRRVSITFDNWIGKPPTPNGESERSGFAQSNPAPAPSTYQAGEH